MHNSTINAMVNEIIEGVSVLFSTGVDKLINMWDVDSNGIKKPHFIKNIETNEEHTESVRMKNFYVWFRSLQ